MKRLLSTYILLLFLSNMVLGQNNYYLRRFEVVPDTTFTNNGTNQYFALYYPDVRSMGKGNTEIADGTKYNAMKSNPALLSFERTNIAEIKVVAGLALETISMVNFVDNSKGNFKNGFTVERILDGVKKYFDNKDDFNLQHEVYKTVLEALEYPQALLRSVVGDINEPQTHGLHAFGEGNIQLGNFGLSVSAYGESEVKADLGPVFTRLAEYEFPQNYDDKEAVALAMSEIGAMLEYAVDKETGIIDPRVLPAIYSFSFFDIATTLGYGRKIYGDLSLGVNLNLVNRRFSSKRVDATRFDKVFEEAFSDFNTSVTGLTLDLGAHYTYANKLSIGMSVQNLFASHKLNSNAELNFKAAQLEKDLDKNGNFIFNDDGDTALVSRVRGYSIIAPTQFAIPIITNIGLHYPINPDWDVAVDMFDVFMQDTKIEKYWNRLRLGTEFRMKFFNENMNLAFRFGYAQLWPTLGLGLNLYNFISLDAAYYNDRRLDSDVALFQITFSL